jgi:hypothetical protein
MKNILVLLFLLPLGSGLLFAQSQEHIKDSCANTADFQITVRSASITASYNLLADTSLHDATVLKYAQKLISDPQGGWITAMSYGCTENVVISCGSPLNDIQFQVNSIYAFQAYAYYQVSPPNALTVAQITRTLNQQTRKDNRKQ